MVKDDGNSLVALRWRLNLFAVGVVLVPSRQPVTLLRLCLPHGVGTLGSQARKASSLPPRGFQAPSPGSGVSHAAVCMVGGAGATQ